MAAVILLEDVLNYWLKLGAVGRPRSELFTIGNEAHASPMNGTLLPLIKSLLHSLPLGTLCSLSLRILLHHQCLMYIVLDAYIHRCPSHVNLIKHLTRSHLHLLNDPPPHALSTLVLLMRLSSIAIITILYQHLSLQVSNPVDPGPHVLLEPSFDSLESQL